MEPANTIGLQIGNLFGCPEWRVYASVVEGEYVAISDETGAVIRVIEDESGDWITYP